MNIDHWLAAVAETPFTQESNPCSDLVQQAERLALANLDEPLHISTLCRALEISEWTLRKAFHKIRGLPPCRHLRMLRLSQARRALLFADDKLATVTEIATCFGFVELGRFSVEYRKVFGESPSQTLHQASSGKIFSVSDAVQDRFAFGVEDASFHEPLNSGGVEVTLEQHGTGDSAARHLKARHPIDAPPGNEIRNRPKQSRQLRPATVGY